MSAEHPLRPALVVNRLFIQAFLAADAPCLALGMVEEQQRLCGMLALRLNEAIPAAIADRGFEFGHALFGNTTFAVLQLVFAFPGFQTYNVLINPNNLVVQALARFSFLRWPEVSHVRGGGGPAGEPGPPPDVDHDGRPISASAHVIHGPSRAAGVLLQWVCRETVAALDLSTDRLTLTPA